MAFQEFELNMIPHGDMPSFYASQYETGRPIIIDIMMGEDAFNCDELYIELHCRKVDDNIVTLQPDSVDGNQVTFIGTDQLFACPGKNVAEICLYVDETKDTSLGSLNFFIEVEPDPMAGGLTSESSIYDLRQQIEEITEEVIGEDYYDKTEVDDLLDDKANTADLATVSTTGDYDDLINKPTIPAAQVQSDWSQADNTQVDYIKNKPDINAMIANALFAVMPVATEGPAATCTFVTEIAAPLQSVHAEVVATQAAGTPTPSNPLPISGYTGVTISVADENMSVQDTYTISWQDEAGTVYGGNIDLTTGLLTVTHTTIEMPSTLNFTYDNTAKRWQAVISGMKSYPTRSADLMAEEWQADTTAAAGSESKMFTVGGACYFYTADNVNQPHGKLVYPLATPQTYQLTPTQVDALLGVNNVFNDTNGDTEVQYKDSIQHYIDTRV